MKRRGFTFVEIAIAGSLFLLLTGLLFSGLKRASDAWRLGAGRTEVLTEAQLMFSKLKRELESSSSASLETGPGILSFASSQGLRDGAGLGDPQVQPEGPLLMQKYIVLYHQAAVSELHWSEYEIPATSAARRMPKMLAMVDIFGTGLEPLSAYAANGRVTARMVESMMSELDGRLLKVTLVLKTDTERTTRYVSSTLIRN